MLDDSTVLYDLRIIALQNELDAVKEARRLTLGHSKHGPPVGHHRADMVRKGWTREHVARWRALKAKQGRRAFTTQDSGTTKSFLNKAVRLGFLKEPKVGLYRFK